MMKLSQESLVKKFEYVKYVKALQAGELQSKYGPGMPVMCSMPLQKVAPKLHYTLPTGEILSSKNARVFLVFGFLMKSIKKYILKI